MPLAAILESINSTNVQFNAYKQQLEEAINDMIINNFSGLVQILYSFDVSEIKLKETLQQNSNTDAAKIITKLLFDRQLLRIQSREKYAKNNPMSSNFSDEEQW